MLTVQRSSRSATRACTLAVRCYATETAQSTPHPKDLPPPLHSPSLTSSSTSAQRVRLYPRPRPAVSHQHSPLPKLPPSFGSNQLLPVSNSTRALLESIVAKFDAPIRYAFAYGSGVFEQDGYEGKTETERPMLDFMFAVTHPAHFHSINMQQFPNHYPFHSRVLGSSYVSRVQNIGPGVWFNAYVPVSGVVRDLSFRHRRLLNTSSFFRQSSTASQPSTTYAPIYSIGALSTLQDGCTNLSGSSKMTRASG